MAKNVKTNFLDEITKRFGALHKLERSQSLFEIRSGAARVYIRYSKIHSRNQAFYGLREVDLQMLQGHPSIICFLWENQKEPLLVPFAEYEEVFHSIPAASDGQYKVSVYIQADGAELYIAKAGRFNVESYFGWESLNSLIDSSIIQIPEMSHSQVQTLLGSIGSIKGYDIWVPATDRTKMDWSLARPFDFKASLPLSLKPVKSIVEEVDVIWIARGAGFATAFFEIEHSTPIYSGLLRFNDIHLLAPNLKPRFSVVSNDERRSLFVRQLHRPTFEISGLSEICTFLEYRNVFGWHNRLKYQKI
jgi:hypothetical protein